MLELTTNLVHVNLNLVNLVNLVIHGLYWVYFIHCKAMQGFRLLFGPLRVSKGKQIISNHLPSALADSIRHLNRKTLFEREKEAFTCLRGFHTCQSFAGYYCFSFMDECQSKKKYHYKCLYPV